MSKIDANISPKAHATVKQVAASHEVSATPQATDATPALTGDRAMVTARPTPGRSTAEILAEVKRVRDDVDQKVGPASKPDFPHLAEAEAAFRRHDPNAFQTVLVQTALKEPSAKVLEMSRYAFDKALESNVLKRGDYLEVSRTLLNVALAVAKTEPEVNDVRSLAMRMSNSIPFPHRTMSSTGMGFQDIAELAVQKARDF